MARVKYVKFTGGAKVDLLIAEIIKAKIVSSYEDKDGNIIIARFGVNKTTLKKLLEKSK
jgi:hypothetical protein